MQLTVRRLIRVIYNQQWYKTIDDQQSWTSVKFWDTIMLGVLHFGSYYDRYAARLGLFP
jgi:hypothetical protein